MPIHPVKPKDAASLVLIRHRAGVAEILMGRRAMSHRFMPGFHVFPGGRLDRADFTCRPLSPLSPRTVEHLGGGQSAVKAQALAVAAVRETFEETGLAIGQMTGKELTPSLDGLGFIARAITPSQSPIRFHARFFLGDGDAAEGRLRSNGELLNLRWFGLDEALSLTLIDVTEFVIGEVAQIVAGQRDVSAPAPLFCYRRGEAVILRDGKFRKFGSPRD